MKFPEQFRDRLPGSPYQSAPGDPFGVFRIPPQRIGKSGITRSLQIIAAAGDLDLEVPWEHVSVSLRGNRRACPTWEEMCLVKSLFWEPSECVIQFHPPESDYVNLHAGCLHLWRPINVAIPTPPLIAV